MYTKDVSIVVFFYCCLLCQQTNSFNDPVYKSCLLFTMLQKLLIVYDVKTLQQFLLSLPLLLVNIKRMIGQLVTPSFCLDIFLQTIRTRTAIITFLIFSAICQLFSLKNQKSAFILVAMHHLFQNVDLKNLVLRQVSKEANVHFQNFFWQGILFCRVYVWLAWYDFSKTSKMYYFTKQRKFATFVTFLS